MNTRGMTRREKLQYQAKQRRIESDVRKTEVPTSVDAFTPEVMYDTSTEEQFAWEEAGVLNNVRNTLDINDNNW